MFRPFLAIKSYKYTRAGRLFHVCFLCGFSALRLRALGRTGHMINFTTTCRNAVVDNEHSHELWSRTEKIVLFNVNIMVTNKSTVVWRGLYSNQQRHLLDLVSTLPKLCCELTRRSQVSPQHFDHCDDEYRCR